MRRLRLLLVTILGLALTVPLPMVPLPGAAAVDCLDMRTQTINLRARAADYQFWTYGLDSGVIDTDEDYLHGPLVAADISVKFTTCAASEGRVVRDYTVSRQDNYDLTVEPQTDGSVTLTPQNGQYGYGTFVKKVTAQAIELEVTKCVPEPMDLRDYMLEATKGVIAIASFYPATPVAIGAAGADLVVDHHDQEYQCGAMGTVRVPYAISRYGNVVTEMPGSGVIAVSQRGNRVSSLCPALRFCSSVDVEAVSIESTGTTTQPLPFSGDLASTGLPWVVPPTLDPPASSSVGTVTNLSGRPAFQLPFPCGEGGWRAEGRASHGTSANAFPADMNWGSGAADKGRAVVASASGVAIFQGGTYNTVRVDHGGGWSSVYRHMSDVTIPVGVPTPVSVGTRLGSVSDVGAASSYHLHYEQLKDGIAVAIVLAGQTAPDFAAGATWYLPASKNCTAGPDALTGSLLGNGSLEVGSVAYWGRSAPANIAFYSDATKAHSGVGFLATNSTSSDGSVFSDVSTSVAVGQVLEGRAWLRAEAGTSTGLLCVWGIGVAANENACTSYSVGAAWTPVEVTLGARGAHSTVRLQVYPAPGSPTVWIDDATLTKDSLLANGSLEVGGVAGWNYSAPANFAFYSDAAKAHSGVGFLATNTSASPGSVYSDVSTSVAVGQVLEGRAWLRAGAGTATGQLCVWGIGVAANENACTSYSVGAAWTPVEVTLGARGAHSTVRVQVYPAPGSPTVWIDDATLTKDSLLANGSLEVGGVAGWNYSAPANFAFYSDAAKAHSGVGFLATNTSASPGSVYSDVSTSVAVGQVLEGRAWLRAGAGTATGQLCVWGIGVAANENACTSYSVGAAWTPVEVTLGARGAHSTVRVQVYPGANAPTVWVDDVSLTR